MLKILIVVILAPMYILVSADAVNDGNIAYPLVNIALVAPTIKTTTSMVNTTTTISITTRTATGAQNANNVGIEVGIIPQTDFVVPTTTSIDPLYFDDWDREQKAKAGLVSSKECPISDPCHGNEAKWLSHLPTLGELINEYFEPGDREFFTWLAYCESSAKPEDIYSDAMHPTSKATGWFQHLPKFWIERSIRAGFVGFSIDHPVANVGVAAWLYYEDGGAKHWKACTNKYIREVVYG